MLYDLVKQGCITDIVQQNPGRCKKLCKNKCKHACMDRPECPEPPPLVVEDCADPAQTTPIHCAPIHLLNDAGKAKFCTETVDRLCSRSCGLCRDGVARFESCDGPRTTEASCQTGVQASVEYDAEAAKNKYCTIITQKSCPVSCMGASSAGEQCPPDVEESCDDLTTTNFACQRGTLPLVYNGVTYNAEAAKNKYCTTETQKTCPVSCMGASNPPYPAGAQCPSLDAP